MVEFGRRLADFSKQPPAPPPDLWLPPGEIVAALAQQGDPVATGIQWLDVRMRRNGITPGRVLTIGGPPYTGKTTVIAEAALKMSETVSVFALFSDEGRSQAAARIGVLLGIPIEEIEEHPDRAGTIITERLGGRRLHLLKPETEFANAQYVYDYAAENSDGTTSVVILDSVQTIPATSEEPENERAGIRAFMRLVRRRSDKDQAITILSSQSNRASYRSRKKEDNSVALASFLGDSSIEYLSDVIIALSIPDKESDIVDAEVAKNRLKPFRSAGYSKIFAVRYSDEQGSMLEVDQAELDAAAETQARTRISPVKLKVIRTLSKHREGLTRAAICEFLNARKADILSALRELVEEKKVYSDQRGRQLFYVLDRSLAPE